VSTVFLVPIIHPKHPNVTDYSRVERLLELTVESALSQTCEDSYVVVSCHRRPAWADRMGHRALLIELPDHPAFEPGRWDRRVDRMIKQSIAAFAAQLRWAPDHMMLLDGDDFVARTLAAQLADGSLGPGGFDGYLLRHGYHVPLRIEGERVAVRSTFKLDDFDRTCGSCRIFHASALLDRIADLVPGAREHATFLAEDGATDFPPLLADFENAVARYGDAFESPLAVLGRHVQLEGHLDLAPVAEPLAAKGLGHGNHVGRARGTIRWQNVVGMEPVTSFMTRFGLDRAHGVVAAPDFVLQAEGAVVAGLPRGLRRLGRRIRRIAS